MYRWALPDYTLNFLYLQRRADDTKERTTFLSRYAHYLNQNVWNSDQLKTCKEEYVIVSWSQEIELAPNPEHPAAGTCTMHRACKSGRLEMRIGKKWEASGRRRHAHGGSE